MSEKRLDNLVRDGTGFQTKLGYEADKKRKSRNSSGSSKKSNNSGYDSSNSSYSSGGGSCLIFALALAGIGTMPWVWLLGKLFS